MNFLDFFNVNNTFLTVLGYPMSYLEFFGTIFNLWSVWLVAKNNIWTWPIGLIGVILFGILFYQIQLYSDFAEQIYYFITTFYGWWLWLKVNNQKGETQQEIILKSSRQINILAIIATTGLTYFVTLLMQNIHLLLPTLFPVAASLPFLDALTTIMSFTATIYMAQKRIENWYYWIVVDILGIGVYYHKGVVFIALLYLIFLILATKGLFNWKKIYDNRTCNR